MRIRSRNGFTLMEILVVLGIISILAAILFPAFASARERARSAQCISNLRQIGMAFHSYVQDWDGGYPNTDNPFLWMGRFWRWPLKSYLGFYADQVHGDPLHSTGDGESVLYCPSDPSAPDSFDNTSYAYSMAFYTSPDAIDTMDSFGDTVTPPGPPCTTQAESAVAYPSEKVLVTEWLSNHESPHVGWNDPSTAWDGARNCLFADGHCRTLKSRQIKPANDNLPDINLTRNGILGKDVD